MACGLVSNEANAGDRGGGLMGAPTFAWPETELKPVDLETSGSEPFGAGTPWAGKPGWVQFASQVLLAGSCDGQEAFGPVLMAEWVEGDGKMHRIFPDPAGGGGLVHRHVREIAGGQSWLRQRVTILGGGKATSRKLIYHVYWSKGQDGALDRMFDMFAGFDGDA